MVKVALVLLGAGEYPITLKLLITVLKATKSIFFLLLFFIDCWVFFLINVKYHDFYEIYLFQIFDYFHEHPIR